MFCYRVQRQLLILGVPGTFSVRWMLRSCFSSKPHPSCNELGYRTSGLMILWPLTSLLWIPRTPSVSHLQTSGGTIMHSAPLLRSRGASPFPCSQPFLLSPFYWVVILFWATPTPTTLHIKAIQTVNSMVKNPSLDLTVHGINSSISLIESLSWKVSKA